MRSEVSVTARAQLLAAIRSHVAALDARSVQALLTHAAGDRPHLVARLAALDGPALLHLARLLVVMYDQSA